GPAVRLPGPPAGPAERGLGLGGGHQQQRGGPGGAQPPEEAGAQSGPPPIHPDGPGGGLQTGLPPRRRGCRPGGSGPGVRGAALSQRFRSAARAGTLQGYRPARFFRPTRHLLTEGPGSRLESVGSTKRKGGTRAKGLSRHTTSRRWLVTAYKSDYPQTPELATSWILYKLHRPMTRLTSTSASHAKKPDAHPAAPGHSGSTTGPNSGGPRRFQCPGCGKVFTERLPGIRPWARQTEHAKALSRLQPRRGSPDPGSGDPQHPGSQRHRTGSVGPHAPPLAGGHFDRLLVVSGPAILVPLGILVVSRQVCKRRFPSRRGSFASSGVENQGCLSLRPRHGQLGHRLHAQIPPLHPPLVLLLLQDGADQP